MKSFFREKVYAIVQKIPRGRVMTYKQIAIRLGNPRLARAVGNALHRNPDPRRIPCHRVIRCDGQLAKNYAFGGPKVQKRKLIKEGIRFCGSKLPAPVIPLTLWRV